jgi:hypothetical protein
VNSNFRRRITSNYNEAATDRDDGMRRMDTVRNELNPKDARYRRLR